MVGMGGFGCAGSCTSPCAVLVVGDASREPGWSPHTLVGGAEKGKVV